MNGPNIYDISNPNISSYRKFSTNYSDIHENVEYFDVYSHPISSRYGDVYWTMMEPVILPNNIIKRFNNKVMAIVGYEMDQVFDDNKSVPITWAYNHHYEAYLQGANSIMVKINQSSKNDWGMNNHGAKQKWMIQSLSQDRIPTSQFFSEANGGESRNSFHGYPKNMAQLIRSPRLFRLQPMQIDTRNRDPKYINNTNYHPGILPKRSAAPKDATYSGLLECPCTTRINKQIYYSYGTSTQGRCFREVLNKTICYQEVSKIAKVPFNISSLKELNSNKYPYGCSFVLDENNQVKSIILNKLNSEMDFGNGNQALYGTTGVNNITNVSLTLKIDKKVEIILSGPSNLWYGLAFNAHSMADLPYAIIVNGTGSVFEVKLGNHDGGQVLKSSLNIISNKLNNGMRTLTLSRDLEGLNSDYYSFQKNQTTIPILSALGSNPKYSYHHYRTGSTIELGAVNKSTCLCDLGVKGSINGIPFSKNCASEPTGDLLQQKNPTCFIDTYQGGLLCCHHKNVLLDKDQIQPSNQMTYQLKFRFWFQEYNNHQSLKRLYFQTEAYSGEYDIPKCSPNKPKNECIHSITARFKADQLLNSFEKGNSSGVKLIYAGPHCHAPTCISMELYNADTGDLLCHVDGDLGKGRNNIKYDEPGYIKINPCLWGYDEGLLEPPQLSWNTNLISIKKNNNTNAHYGEMASWQMRGVLI